MSEAVQDSAEAEENRTVKPRSVGARLGDWWTHRYTFTGTAVGLVFLWLSLTPSLLPRGPLFQSLVSGGAGAIGYLIGVLAVWLVRFLRSKESSAPAPVRAWWILLGTSIVGTIGMVFFFDSWQDRLRDIMDTPRLGFVAYLQIGVLSVVVLYLLVEVGKGIRWIVLWLSGRLNRVCPPRVSAVIAVVLVVFLGVEIINGVVVRGTMNALNTTFSKVNNEGGNDRPAPTSAFRSGGPGSVVEWASLGKQGRVFVSNAQTVEHLTAFNGAPAMEPIRAYAGLESADSGNPNRYKAIAENAAQELERTGGLRRKVVAVARDHRHRLGERSGGRGARVHVQRRHRHREHAVLVPAQLVVVHRRQAERAGRGPGAVRGRRQAGQGAPGGHAPETGRVR